MTKPRILLAGIAGGIAMFLWASLAHIVLPLGSTGVQQIDNNEAAVLASIQGALGQASGLYIFPSTGAKPGDSSEKQAAAMKAYDQKLAANPSGLLIYHPPGAKSFTPGQLGTEFLSELIQSLLAVFLLAQTRLSSYAARVGFIISMGIVASITTNISYWNWYGFPGTYTSAYMLIEIAGFAAAGLAAAAFMREKAARPRAAAA